MITHTLYDMIKGQLQLDTIHPNVYKALLEIHEKSKYSYEVFQYYWVSESSWETFLTSIIQSSYDVESLIFDFLHEKTYADKPLECLSTLEDDTFTLDIEIMDEVPNLDLGTSQVSSVVSLEELKTFLNTLTAQGILTLNSNLFEIDSIRCLDDSTLILFSKDLI